MAVKVLSVNTVQLWMMQTALGLQLMRRFLLMSANQQGIESVLSANSVTKAPPRTYRQTHSANGIYSIVKLRDWVKMQCCAIFYLQLLEPFTAPDDYEENIRRKTQWL